MTRRSHSHRQALRRTGNTTAAQIARINELSQTARTTWFALLGYLAFVGVTLLGVQDADFFIETRQTDLPLVGVAIPTSSFFKFAPILGAALYIYLHLHLSKLWEALHAPPPTPSGRPLDEQIYPWLVNDLVLRIRKDGAASPRPLDSIAGFVTRLLVWAAGPIVLLSFWWRSMPAHDEWMTLLIALTLLLSLYAGFASWWRLRACRLPEGERRPVWSGWLKRPVGVMLALLIVAISWLRAEAGFDHYAMKAIDLYEDVMNGGDDLPRFTGRTFPNGDDMAAQYAQEIDVRRWVWTLDDLTLDREKPKPLLELTIRLFAALEGRFTLGKNHSTLARTELRGVEIVPGTADLAPRDVARRRFRADWCRRQGLEPSVCGNLYTVAEPAPWFIEPNRHSWCLENNSDALPPPAPENSDLTPAAASHAKVNDSGPASPLTPEHAARCDKHFADLDIDFREEWEQERQSTLAQLERRDLRGRDLRGADMARANLTDADLSGARMEGADLRDITVSADSDFTAAVVQYAAVRYTNFGSVNLGQDQVNALFGDGSVILPPSIVRPAHWPPERLDWYEFETRWRAWQAENGYTPRTRN